jgi:hypothetical protein
MDFLITISVPDSSADGCRKLTSEMRKKAFTPISENGMSRYASFSYRGSLPIKDVINRVASVVAKTGAQYSFTVMKSKG